MDARVSRRDVFGKAFTWALGLVTASVGLFAPLRSILGAASQDDLRGPAGFLPLGPLSDLSSEPREVNLSGAVRDGWLLQAQDLGSVWVFRDGDQPRAFSSICPHLGCSVDFDPASKHFLCPCHASVFGPGGEVLAGPSPRSLDPLPVRLDDGKVSCRYLRFEPGVPVRRAL